MRCILQNQFLHSAPLIAKRHGMEGFRWDFAGLGVLGVPWTAASAARPQPFVKAWEMSDPNMTAKTVLRGWIDAYGPAFENGVAVIAEVLS